MDDVGIYSLDCRGPAVVVKVNGNYGKCKLIIRLCNTEYEIPADQFMSLTSLDTAAQAHVLAKLSSDQRRHIVDKYGNKMEIGDCVLWTETEDVAFDKSDAFIHTGILTKCDNNPYSFVFCWNTINWGDQINSVKPVHVRYYADQAEGICRRVVKADSVEGMLLMLTHDMVK